MTQWDIKQIIDVVSKGVNSVLMNNPKVEMKELRKIAKGLVKIYKKILDDLKEGEEEKKKEPEL